MNNDDVSSAGAFEVDAGVIAGSKAVVEIASRGISVRALAKELTAVVLLVGGLAI